MQLTEPGILPYSAEPVSWAPVPDSSRIIVSCRVWDDRGNLHNGLAIDGTTAQPFLDVELDAANPPADLRGFIHAALQRVYIAECGGFEAALESLIRDQVRFS